MTARTVTFDVVKELSIGDLAREVIDQQEVLTVRLPSGKGIVIQPSPQTQGSLEEWRQRVNRLGERTSEAGAEDETPNALAMARAQEVLGVLADEDLSPTHTVASAEGGVALCFIEGGKYADIECLNTGNVLASTSDGTSRPDVWEVDQNGLRQTAARIRAFIRR